MDGVEIVQILANYGVAIFIAVYFSYWITNTLTGKLDTLISSINELKEAVKDLSNKIDRIAK